MEQEGGEASHEGSRSDAATAPEGLLVQGRYGNGRMMRTIIALAHALAYRKHTTALVRRVIRPIKTHTPPCR
jgi:hypothetical protein